MSPIILISFLLIYFGIIFIISQVVSKNNSSNESFFIANKNSKWYLVAFGMIGTMLSGVTFISVPGSVSKDGFAYFQYVLGMSLGFMIVIFILLPLYYKLNITSIYSYLGLRFGKKTQKIGAILFLVSRVIGSAARLYLVVIVLQKFIFSKFNISFEITVLICICFIWLYTHKAGLKAIIITDTLQTCFFLLALIITIIVLYKHFNLSFWELTYTLYKKNYTTIFFKSDFIFNKNHFVKQIIGGCFVTIAMIGLDQDLMQKNLSLKNIREAKKNMLWLVLAIIIINFLFLCVGALLKLYIDTNVVNYANKADYIFPILAIEHLGFYSAMFFLLGLTASTFSTTDSALTALTTSFCIDILNFDKKNQDEKNKKIRILIHAFFSFLIFIVCIILNYVNNDSMVKIIFTIAAYTYGPLLALYIIGLYTKINIKEKYLIIVAVCCPIICYCLVEFLKIKHIYNFNFELIILNALITIIGLYVIKTNNNKIKFL